MQRDNNCNILLVHHNKKCIVNIDKPHYTHSWNQDLFKKSVSILGTEDVGKLTLFNIRICYLCMSDYFYATSTSSFISRAKINHYSIHPMVKR